MIYQIQIDDEVRNATPDEVAQIEANAAQKLAEDKAIADKASAKAALLAKLGITADEAALLLG